MMIYKKWDFSQFIFCYGQASEFKSKPSSNFHPLHVHGDRFYFHSSRAVTSGMTSKYWTPKKDDMASLYQCAPILHWIKSGLEHYMSSKLKQRRDRQNISLREQLSLYWPKLTQNLKQNLGEILPIKSQQSLVQCVIITWNPLRKSIGELNITKGIYQKRSWSSI